MLKTDIAMVSTQKLDISTADAATVVDVQPLPPGKYALNHIGYYANALQSWRIFHNVAPQVIDVPAKTVLYMGEYVASQGGGMSVRDREERDMSIVLKKHPHLASLPRKVQVPGARPRMDAGVGHGLQQGEA